MNKSPTSLIIATICLLISCQSNGAANWSPIDGAFALVATAARGVAAGGGILRRFLHQLSADLSLDSNDVNYESGIPDVEPSPFDKASWPIGSGRNPIPVDDEENADLPDVVKVGQSRADAQAKALLQSDAGLITPLALLTLEYTRGEETIYSQGLRWRGSPTLRIAVARISQTSISQSSRGKVPKTEAWVNVTGNSTFENFKYRVATHMGLKEEDFEFEFGVGELGGKCRGWHDLPEHYFDNNEMRAHNRILFIREKKSIDDGCNEQDGKSIDEAALLRLDGLERRGDRGLCFIEP